MQGQYISFMDNVNVQREESTSGANLHRRKRQRSQNSGLQQKKQKVEKQNKQNDGQQTQQMSQQLENKIPPKPETLDKEIEDLAKTIRQSNEKKMVQIRNTPVFHTIQNVEMSSAAENITEDWTSVQGQFGWVELGTTLIPYLTRSGEKFVSLRMANTKVFVKYKQLFSDEIRNCFKIEKLQVTKAEAQLLNEINFRHCDNIFGRTEFTVDDGILTLREITEMYEFLEFCYIKLIEKNPAPHKRCGFIRIACQNCVPYVWYDNVQYVPLFYFEGDCKYLDERATELRGWELAYLKLSCKIQGIRKELFDEESIRVVTLQLLMKFFPPNTQFQDIWPTEFNTESLIHKPVPKLISIEPNDHSQKIIMNVSGNPKRAMQMRTTLQKLPATVVTSQSAGVATIQNGLKPRPPQHSYRNNRSVGPPNACVIPSKQNTYLNQYINSLAPTASPSMNRCSNTLTNTTVPNVPTYQQTNPPYINRDLYSNQGNNITNTYRQTPTVRQVPMPGGSSAPNVLQISDVNCANTGCPYFLIRSQVEDKVFNFCLNMEPYVTTTLLVSLEEISEGFFNVAMDRVSNAINVMRLNIFFPNKLQIRTLERNNRYPTRGLIKIRDFIDNLPQIRYILTHN